MPIHRHSPGEIAPRSGTYALVGHYGEPLRLTVERIKGDRLPLAIAGKEFGELWWVLVDEAQPQTSSEAA